MKYLVMLFVLLTALCSFGQLPTCPVGTMASYAGTTCQQDGVVFAFPADTYSVAGPFDVDPADVTVRLDPNGPHTLLIGSPAWHVGPGQLLVTVIRVKVTGADAVNAWAHRCFATLDGEVDASQFVFPGNGFEPVEATATCTAGTDSAPQAGALYPDSTNTVSTRIIVRLYGGLKGSAQLGSIGVHFIER
jgi:hypothetical protein